MEEGENLRWLHCAVFSVTHAAIPNRFCLVATPPPWAKNTQRQAVSPLAEPRRDVAAWRGGVAERASRDRPGLKRNS